MTEGLAIAILVIVVGSVAALVLETRADARHREVVRLINLLATFIGEQSGRG
jgi:hypothetical protein